MAACGRVCSYVSTSSLSRARAAAPLKQAASQGGMDGIFCCLSDSKPGPSEYLLCNTISLLTCQLSKSHLLFLVTPSFFACWGCIFRHLPSCVPCLSGPATAKMKDFKPVSFRNAGKMVCGALRAVSKAEEGVEQRELSTSLSRWCVTQEGTRHGMTLNFLTSSIFSKMLVMEER